MLDGAGLVLKTDNVAAGDRSCSLSRIIVPSRVTYIDIQDMCERNMVWLWVLLRCYTTIATW